jgi:fermentation-respiration switch protein FrsA (DUF1100 family)
MPRALSYPVFLLAGLIVAVVALRLLVPRILPRFIYFPQRLAVDEADPDRWGLPEAEAVRITASDGVTLHGWWLPAPSEERCGVAIYLHGNAGSIAGRGGIGREISDAALDVLFLDYRGYGASAGSPSETGFYRDADAAWLHVREERGIAPDRIVLFGESMGGAVAVDLATRRQVGALVLVAPLPGTVPVARALYPWVPDIVLDWIAERFDAMARVSGIEAPVLVAQGTADRIIPPGLTRALYDAAPEPKTWYPAEGFGHNDLYDDVGFWRAFRTFVRDALECRALP